MKQLKESILDPKFDGPNIWSPSKTIKGPYIDVKKYPAINKMLGATGCDSYIENWNVSVMSRLCGNRLDPLMKQLEKEVADNNLSIDLKNGFWDICNFYNIAKNLAETKEPQPDKEWADIFDIVNTVYDSSSTLAKLIDDSLLDCSKNFNSGMLKVYIYKISPKWDFSKIENDLNQALKKAIKITKRKEYKIKWVDDQEFNREFFGHEGSAVYITIH